MIDIFLGTLLAGWNTLFSYLSEHVVTCLIPAFFIAGAIAAFIKKDAILTYFSPDAKKSVSYGIASISGTVLAVCSCTILPMFAGILKKREWYRSCYCFPLCRSCNKHSCYRVLCKSARS